MEETVRLNKFLSEKGICSRREADRLVDEGKVMVNGVCAVMGQKVAVQMRSLWTEKRSAQSRLSQY